jgi:tryptophan synthase beta chain
MAPLEELTAAFESARADNSFQPELDSLLRDYAGRPTPLFFAKRLTSHSSGARIYLKREDLLHTGAHKINNTLGQILLARRMGKKRIIAETGAGQHGVATATSCVVRLNVSFTWAPKTCGVRHLTSFACVLRGNARGRCRFANLKDAINEALRDWVRMWPTPII